MNPDRVLVGAVCPWVKLLQINQYNLKPKKIFRHGISNNTLNRNRRDAIFDEIVNRDLDCKNFDRSVGIVSEKDIKYSQKSIFANSDGDHHEGFKCFVYCQKIGLMIL